MGCLSPLYFFKLVSATLPVSTSSLSTLDAFILLTSLQSVKVGFYIFFPFFKGIDGWAGMMFWVTDRSGFSFDFEDLFNTVWLLWVISRSEFLLFLDFYCLISNEFVLVFFIALIVFDLGDLYLNWSLLSVAFRLLIWSILLYIFFWLKTNLFAKLFKSELLSFFLLRVVYFYSKISLSSFNSLSFSSSLSLAAKSMSFCICSYFFKSDAISFYVGTLTSCAFSFLRD